MHELGIVTRILEICLDQAQDAGATSIAEIHLVIGDLSTVVDDSVVFYWDIVSQGTMAEGAKLAFHRVAAELTCDDCQTSYPMQDRGFRCPDCEGRNVRVSAGDEFFIQHIDVEMEEDLLARTEVAEA